MTLTEIIERDPTHLRHLAGPTTALDGAIVEYLRLMSNAVPLRQITKAVDGTTHHVHARVTELVRKGLVERIPNPNGPTRGPGASRYQLVGA